MILHRKLSRRFRVFSFFRSGFGSVSLSNCLVVRLNVLDRSTNVEKPRFSTQKGSLVGVPSGHSGQRQSPEGRRTATSNNIEQQQQRWVRVLSDLSSFQPSRSSVERPRSFRRRVACPRLQKVGLLTPSFVCGGKHGWIRSIRIATTSWT